MEGADMQKHLSGNGIKNTIYLQLHHGSILQDAQRPHPGWSGQVKYRF
jgi:hypothetical protein